MIVISLVIGVGIFRTPAIVARQAGSPEIFFSAWIVGGLVSLLGAFAFAEIGSRHHFPGGFYKLISEAFHPLYAFMINWALVLTYGAGMAGVALLGCEYRANGCPLGWLIDRKGKAVYIYRADGTIEIVKGEAVALSGEEVLPGLVVEIEF